MKHLDGIEFMSIWKLAHAWANVDVASTSPDALPQSVKDSIQLIIVGHNRGDLPLRGKWFFFDQANDSVLSTMVSFPILYRLTKCLSKNVFLISHDFQPT